MIRSFLICSCIFIQSCVSLPHSDNNTSQFSEPIPGFNEQKRFKKFKSVNELINYFVQVADTEEAKNNWLNSFKIQSGNLREAEFAAAKSTLQGVGQSPSYSDYASLIWYDIQEKWLEDSSFVSRYNAVCREKYGDIWKRWLDAYYPFRRWKADDSWEGAGVAFYQEDPSFTGPENYQNISYEINVKNALAHIGASETDISGLKHVPAFAEEEIFERAKRWASATSRISNLLKDNGYVAYRTYELLVASCSEEDKKEARIITECGWSYTLPEPKSPQAMWGNSDGRTTWYSGYWFNSNTKRFSASQPSPENNYAGDGEKDGWRRGGYQKWPTRIEWLCSTKNSREPETREGTIAVQNPFNYPLLITKSYKIFRSHSYIKNGSFITVLSVINEDGSLSVKEIYHSREEGN